MQEHNKFKDYMTQSILKEHLESLVKVKKILGNVISEKRIVTQLAQDKLEKDKLEKALEKKSQYEVVSDEEWIIE